LAEAGKAKGQAKGAKQFDLNAAKLKETVGKEMQDRESFVTLMDSHLCKV